MDLALAREELLRLHDHLVDEDRMFSESLAISLEDEVEEETVDQHIGDVGSVTLDREMELSIQGNTEHLLAQVNRALEKIEQGTYGRCDRCGREIGEGRLQAVPYANLCLEHQRELERSE